MAPDRAFQIVFEVGHPIARLDQRRPRADGRVSQLHPICRTAEADVLRALDRFAGDLRGQLQALPPIHRIDIDRPRDVFQVPRPECIEHYVQRAIDLLEHLTRDADAARLGDALEPGSDVDPVAIDPRSVVDQIAQIDADPEQHAPVLRHLGIAACHRHLDVGGTFDGGDDARELCKDAVAGGVDDPATELGHQRQHLRLMTLQGLDRAIFVLAHEPTVTGDISGKDGAESSFHMYLPRWTEIFNAFL